METSLILQKVAFLQGVLDPNKVDGGPGQPGPVYRTAIADYIVAELLRDISGSLKDRAHAASLHEIGKELVSVSSRGLSASWDEGDDICPPWRFHFPIPVPGPDPRNLGPVPDPWNLEPQPSPWLQHVTPAMNDIVLAHAVQQLASLTSNVNASAAMEKAGEAIVKGASSRLFDEYCATPVKPRPPAPRSASASA